MPEPEWLGGRFLRLLRPGWRIGQRIRDIVRQTPGLRSGDIVARLREAGVRTAGITSLSDRVYRELRRLVARGVLRRAPNGSYSLAAERQPQNVDAPRSDAIAV